MKFPNVEKIALFQGIKNLFKFINLIISVEAPKIVPGKAMWFQQPVMSAVFSGLNTFFLNLSVLGGSLPLTYIRIYLYVSGYICIHI